MKYWTTLQKLLFLQQASGGGSQEYSGDIVSFVTARAKKLKELTVTLEPIQDLHGYDSPWPAGGGKNKLQLLPTESATSNGVTFAINADGTVSCSGTATGTAVLKIYRTFDIAEDIILNGCPSGGDYSGGYSMIVADTNGSPVTNGIDAGSGATIASANVANIKQIQIIARTGTVMDGKVFKPMIRLATVSDATFAPYENLCPITGHSSASAYVNGVNQWDEDWELGTYDASGNPTTSTNTIRSVNYIPVAPNASYYFKIASTWAQVYIYDADKNFISTFGTDSAVNNPKTMPSNAGYIRFRTSVAYGTTYNDDISINYPSTDTDYHAYQGNLFSVEFPALGANQWDEEWEVGGINVLGDKYATSDRIRSKNYIPVKPNTSYYRATPNNIQPFFYDANKAFISYGYWGTGSFTTPENAYFALFQADPAYGTTYGNNIAINYPSTVTTYEPYTNTVYSGTVDLVTGRGVIDMASMDMGKLSWNYVSAQGVKMMFYATLSDGKQADTFGGLCDIFPIVVTQDEFLSKDKVARLYGSSAYHFSRIGVRDDDYTDGASFKAAMSGKQLVYELATPIEIQLSPQEIKSLVGQNTVWSPDGSVKVRV